MLPWPVTIPLPDSRNRENRVPLPGFIAVPQYCPLIRSTATGSAPAASALHRGREEVRAGSLYILDLHPFPQSMRLRQVRDGGTRPYRDEDMVNLTRSVCGLTGSVASFHAAVPQRTSKPMIYDPSSSLRACFKNVGARLCRPRPAAALLNFLAVLRACFKNGRGPAARDFCRGHGGETGASPLRAVTVEPTRDPGKSTAARRVFPEKAPWLRCFSVAERRLCSLVAPRQRAFSGKTGPLRFLKQALRNASFEQENHFDFARPLRV
jgi:hypothetical protein